MGLGDVAVGHSLGGDKLGGESRNELLGDDVGRDLGIQLLTLPRCREPGNLWSQAPWSLVLGPPWRRGEKEREDCCGIPASSTVFDKEQVKMKSKKLCPGHRGGCRPWHGHPNTAGSWAPGASYRHSRIP